MKQFILFSIFSFAIMPCLTAGEQVIPASKNGARIAFTENKGQVYDQNYKACPDVLYGAMAGNLAVHIKNNGISYQLFNADKKKEKQAGLNIYRIDLNWLNANTNFTRSEDETLPGNSNYYFENCPDGATNVKSYKGITLHNLYNGINLHYYEKHGDLKHDYIIAPHANYKQIQLKLEGATASLNKDGSLLLNTPFGKVHEGAPIVYQNGKQLKAKWVIKTDSKLGQTISFDILNYNQNQELIIDPVTRLWGTYYGGTGTDQGTSCVTDASGNVYMAGLTTSSGTIIATTGAHQTSFGGLGNYDAYLVKFNSSGVRQWGTFYGSTGNDLAYSCCVDVTGNVFMSGYTSLNTGTVIATAGAHQTTQGGNLDAFLVKFNSSGVRQWGTYYGGAGDDLGRSCRTDASGNIYLAGNTASNTGTIIATTGAHQSAFGGGGGLSDGFLVKFNSSGVRQWGTYYGGTGTDEGTSCVTDAAGNVFMVGSVSVNSGTIISTPGSHQIGFGGGLDDAYVVKFNTSGVRQWGSYYGGNGDETGSACTIDASGNIFISGYTSTSGGTSIATVGAHQTAFGGTSDAFLAKFNNTGTRQWGTYYGGTGNDLGASCFTNAFGDVYLSGSTSSGTGTVIANSNGFQTTFGGSFDALLVKFNSSGARQWGSYYGGTGDESGDGVTVDISGNIYMAGYTSSNTGTIIATPGSHQTVYGAGSGFYDGFLVKFSDCVALNPTASVSNSICTGATLNFSATVGGTATPIYSWSGPASYTSNVQNPTIVGASTLNVGVYTLSINNAGCIETTTTQVSTIYPLPTIGINSGTICSGNSFTFNATGATNYTLSQGVSLPATFTSSISVNPPLGSTTYSVAGINANGCSNTTTTTILVHPLPTVSVTSSDAVICGPPFQGTAILNASGANTYSWSTSATTSSIAISPSVTTSYTVTGTDNNGCSNKAIVTQSVDPCVGVQELGVGNSEFGVFPNPSNGIFTIQLSENANIEIIDVIGNIISKENLYSGKHIFNLNSKAQGIYFLKVTVNEKTKTVKLIKE